MTANWLFNDDDVIYSLVIMIEKLWFFNSCKGLLYP